MWELDQAEKELMPHFTCHTLGLCARHWTFHPGSIGQTLCLCCILTTFSVALAHAKSNSSENVQSISPPSCLSLTFFPNMSLISSEAPFSMPSSLNLGWILSLKWMSSVCRQPSQLFPRNPKFGFAPSPCFSKNADWLGPVQVSSVRLLQQTIDHRDFEKIWALYGK